VKAIALNEAQSRLDELFEEAQAGSPVLLVRGGEVAKLWFDNFSLADGHSVRCGATTRQAIV